MLTLGERYQIHLKDIKLSHRIGGNIGGSLGVFIIALYFSKIVFDICSGKDVENISEFIIISVFALFVGVGSIWLIYNSYFIQDKPICIGSEGIIDENGNVYPWNKIEYAFPRWEGKSKYYLYIYFKNESNQTVCHTIYLSKYDVNDDELIEAIEGWSGRDIGHYEDYLKDDYVKQQIEEGKITEEQSKVLDEKLSLYTPYFQKKQKEYKMYIIWLLPILVIVYFISKYLCDVKTPLDMYKWFSIIKFLSLRSGFLVLYVFCLGLVGDYKTKKLRRNPDLKDLSEKELDHLLDVHEMKESSLAIKILLILTAIWLFFVIYTILVDYGVLS